MLRSGLLKRWGLGRWPPKRHHGVSDGHGSELVDSRKRRVRERRKFEGADEHQELLEGHLLLPFHRARADALEKPVPWRRSCREILPGRRAKTLLKLFLIESYTLYAPHSALRKDFHRSESVASFCRDATPKEVKNARTCKRVLFSDSDLHFFSSSEHIRKRYQSRHRDR